MAKIISIYDTNNITDAQMIRSHLEAAEIPCYIAGENLTRPYDSFFGGYLRIMIDEDDKTKATELITQVKIIDNEETKNTTNAKSQTETPLNLVLFLVVCAFIAIVYGLVYLVSP